MELKNSLTDIRVPTGFCYIEEPISRSRQDGVLDYCLCEKIDEDSMRYIVKRIVRNESAMKKALLYGIVVLLVLAFQAMLGKVGSAVADSLSYERLDPQNAFLWNSIHHITEMAIVLAVILLLAILLKADFGFGIGDWRKGIRYVGVYTAVFAGIALACHILMRIYNMLPTYDFPLNSRNVLGTLGFQLFLSGPAEELLFRALPITVLVRIFGMSVQKRHGKHGITHETVIASVLFAAAHVKWSLFPFAIEANAFQLVYAFALGVVQGKAYQDSHSILYPICMHSISNVLMVGTGYLFLSV